MKISNHLTTLALISALLILNVTALPFSLEIPEDIAKLPEEESAQWVEDQMLEAHREQIAVGKERYEKRIQEKVELQRHLKKQALKNRRLIRQARFAYTRDEQKSQTAAYLSILLCAAIVLPLAAILVYRKKQGEQVTVPKINSKFKSKKESRLERNEALNMLQDYLIRKKNNPDEE